MRRYLPRIRSISAICCCVSGPNSIAPAFSFTWATVRKPGIGIVLGLRSFASVGPSGPQCQGIGVMPSLREVGIETQP